jgi:hypothetical protein
MGFARKIKRRQLALQKKMFLKEFKRTMRKFKKLVRCSVCDREPIEGENIDNWHIDKNSENIDLICESCIDSPEEAIQDEV